MIRSCETVKILDIRALLKIVSGRKFQHRIPNKSGKFRTYDNPALN